MTQLQLTIIGNLTRDPELKTLHTGNTLCKFTVAHTPRMYNSNTDEWTDGDTTFLDCVAWGAFAEQINETLSKGTRVIVTGRLKTERWEKDGAKRSKLTLDADDVAPSMRFACVLPDPTGDDPYHR